MYQILRLQKLKSVYSLRRSLAHSYRDIKTPNADPALKKDNQMVGLETAKEAIECYQDKLNTVKGKIRSNAVFALEFLITASPEWFKGRSMQEQTEYFNGALKWLRTHYGADNFIVGGVHRDEKTPHLYAYFIPLKDQKLNAKHYVGGHRDRLVQMQTDFHEQVSKQFGLERGQHGSKAEHIAVKKWYAMINKVMNLPRISKYNQLRDLISGELDNTIQAASASAVEAQVLRDRALGQVKAAREALKRAESVSERLANTDKLEAALAASEAKRAAYEREYRNLKDIFETHKQDFQEVIQKKLGIDPARSAPEVLPTERGIKIDPNPVGQVAQAAQILKL